MKTKYFILFLFTAITIANVDKTLAQSNSYNNVRITHKIGQFYTNDYQDKHRRAQQADPYTNDTFDETSNGWDKSTVGNYDVQKTHEYRTIIYLEPEKTRTLYLPGNKDNKHLSMYNYQRWYNYSNDEKCANGVIRALNPNDQYMFDFANGLVGGNFMENRTDDYDRVIVGVNFTMPKNTDVYYLACDVSNYTDVSKPKNNSGTITEPTLSQRVIFEIHAAKDMQDQLKNCTGDKYLETYNYHYPAKRISTNTQEQVALRLEAQNYYAPGESGSSAGSLNYEVVGGGNYVTGKGTLNRSQRVIPFTVNNDNYSESNRHVQIKVYKTVSGTTYNIALFNLTFDENTEGLSQTTLSGISISSEKYKRTNDYLEKNKYTLITRLDMDYENIVYGGSNADDYHPYPMNWGYSSYGAFVAQNNKSGVPQWGEYAITKAFPWGDNDQPLKTDATGKEDGYHLYLDANQLPGTICKLPFRENLCAGARLYVTAYVKSMGKASSTQCDANLLFIIKGVDGEGNEETLYTQASGQIPRGHNNNTDEPEWYQIYFSYTNGNKVYDHYLLQLENNCANTQGADMCLDDIRVYMNPLHVSAQTVEPVCADNSNVDVQLRLNYEMLVNRLGMTEGKNETKSGYYSFLNKTIFDREFDENNDNYQKAFEAALVKGNGVYNTTSQWYGTFTFNSNFNLNGDESGKPTGTGAGREGEGENRVIYFTSSIITNQDVTSSLIPGETYYIVYNASTFTPENATSIEKIADMYDFSSICTVKGNFLVEGPLVVKVNGEVQTEAETSCIGQIPLVNVELRDGLQGGNIVEGAVFDWYFGDMTAFKNEQSENGVDLETALANFRYFYPSTTSIDESIIPQNENTWLLTQDEIDFIKKLNEDYSLNGANPKLTLSASSDLTIRLLQAETHIVLIPVGTKPSENIKICWEPTQFTLYAQDKAPSLSVGRTDVNYPKGAYPQGSGVNIRMDLAQYNEITSKNDALTIPVRDPKLGDDDAIVTQINSQKEIYLIGTTDPDYKEKLGNGFEYVVGSVNNFKINANMGAFSSAVQLKFDKQKLDMKEGYEYDLTFRFKTEGSKETPDDEEDLLCFGNLVVPIRVVPAYQVWIGGKDGNWNNDNNWRRADYDELNKTEQTYTSNEKNGTSNGYAPMMSTNIVIPDLTTDGQGQIELYTPTFKNVFEIATNKPGHIGNATNLIEYDLVVRPRGSAEGIETAYFAGRYYTNQCNEVHFSVNSEMLHSELLTHNKAWTDVEIPTGQWTLVSTPINGVYSGDWYTKTNGKENAEYFESINWDSANNNRLKPMMTQRSWDGNANIVSNSSIHSATISSVNWSSTFNAVDVAYTPGKGFSIHANMGSNYNDKVMFRFPKSDTSYTGFSNSPLERSEEVNYGKLATAVMASLGQGGEFDESSAKPYEVEITPSQDGNYLMIGNPFVAHLDMTKFLLENGSILENEYWATNENGNPLSGVIDNSKESWITSDGTNNALIPPYTAFYVKLKNQSTAEQTITFKRDMAALKIATTSTTENLQGFILQATGKNGGSTALLRYEGTAENGFVNGEDVQLMTHASGITTPMVYTTAGDMAANINQVKDLQRIPLGLFAADNEVTNLTFRGVSALREPTLHDELEGTATPITEGMTLQIAGSSHGRYYITSLGGGDGTTGIEETTATEDAVEVSSPAHRQVVVTANSGIEGISIYSANGTLLRRVTPAGDTTCTIDGVASGVAVVMVKTANNNDTFKIIIK